MREKDKYNFSIIYFIAIFLIIIWILVDIKDNTKRIIELLHLNNSITNDILIEVSNGNRK